MHKIMLRSVVSDDVKAHGVDLPYCFLVVAVVRSLTVFMAHLIYS